MAGRPLGKRALTATERQRRWRAKIKHAEAIERRAAVVAKLAKVTLPDLATLPRFNVLLIDPPWRFETRSEAGKGRSAENHYPTMTLAELKALTLPAAPHSILFMWATQPMLAQAIELMAHWQFACSGFLVWDKQRIGTGYRFRSQAELLLYGTRGRGVPIPLPGDRVPNLISIKRSNRHSEKPREIAELIARQYAGLPRVELFARSHPGDGWAVWGNEAPGS